MKVETLLTENESEILRAFQDTLHYCVETQNSSLGTRDAISYLIGRLKFHEREVSNVLAEILKNTK